MIPSEYQLDTNLSTRGAEYTRLRQRSWEKFFDFQGCFGEMAGGKNRRWGKFLEITANSAPLLFTEQRCLNKKQEINFQVNKIF